MKASEVREMSISDLRERIEAEKEAQASRDAAQAREAEAVAKVDAAAPPVVQPPVEAEQVYKCTFTVHATKPQLRRLKEFLNQEGIRYE